MMDSLSEANPSSEQGMTGGMLDYDNSFNEMLAADAQRRTCRPTAASLVRFLILAPTAGHWLFLFWAEYAEASVDVIDSHKITHKIHIRHTHAFTV